MPVLLLPKKTIHLGQVWRRRDRTRVALMRVISLGTPPGVVPSRTRWVRMESFGTGRRTWIRADLLTARNHYSFEADK